MKKYRKWGTIGFGIALVMYGTFSATVGAINNIDGAIVGSLVLTVPGAVIIAVGANMSSKQEN